ncbi:MAG TPA: hypothetical protein VHU23_11560 [Rhizomicrobium sp.]|nr:hypothetical protein [Rhizomicrobium sp.]
MIWRSGACASLLLLLSSGEAPSVRAAEDNASAVLSDCSAPDLPQSAMDSCLERVRVLDETDPSAQLQSLEAQLEQRETGKRTARSQPRSLEPGAGPAPVETMPDRSQPTVVESEHYLPPAAAEPDQGRSAANAGPAPEASDERDSSYGQQRWVEPGADRPPPGINDDQPPVADPPDNEAPQDRSSETSDDPQ